MRRFRACLKSRLWEAQAASLCLFSAKGAVSFQPGATPQENAKSRDSGLKATAVELRMKSLSGRQGLARALTRNLTLSRELESKTKSKSKSKRQATVLNSTAVGLKARPIVPAINRLVSTIDRAFSAVDCNRHASWGVAPGWNNDAPLALNKCPFLKQALRVFITAVKARRSAKRAPSGPVLGP